MANLETTTPPVTEIPGVSAEALDVRARQVESGLDLAHQWGFNLQESLAANTADLQTPAELNEYEGRVRGRAAEMANEAGLSDEFFERPVNTVLLMAVADSWLGTEDREARATGYDPAISAEREMLTDVLLIAAGDTSRFVRELNESSPRDAHKYAGKAELPAYEKEYRSFVDRIHDQELSEQVTSILNASGDGSFLAEQRAAFGVTPETEDRFTVRVLNLAEHRYDLQQVGMIGEFKSGPAWRPDMSDDERDEFLAEHKRASDENERQDQIAQPYLDAYKEYQERFEADMGPLPGAYVNIAPDGKRELVIMAATARVLIDHANGTHVADEGHIGRELATVRHEYSHTQRALSGGAHNQLGRSLEERKAELLSGDRLGYQDIKFMIRDVGFIANTDMLPLIRSAVRTEDPLSSFAATASGSIGLRSTLLMIASKPRNYEVALDTRREHANLGCIRQEGDRSLLDSVVRDTLERLGAEDLSRVLGAWAVAEVQGRGVDPDFLRGYISYRKGNGIGSTARFYQQAVDAAAA